MAADEKARVAYPYTLYATRRGIECYEPLTKAQAAELDDLGFLRVEIIALPFPSYITVTMDVGMPSCVALPVSHSRPNTNA